MDDIFTKAKRGDLIALLERYGFYIRKVGSAYRSSRCPACGASDNKTSTKLYITSEWWFCFACGRGGDIITAVQILEQLSPKEAAEWLLGQHDMTAVKKPPLPSTTRTIEINKARLKVAYGLVRIASSASGPRRKIWAYLQEKRGIPEAIIRESLKKKINYFLPDNPFVLNRVIREELEEPLLKESGLLSDTGVIKNIVLQRPIISPFRERGRIIGLQLRAITEVHPKTLSLVRSGLWWWPGAEKDTLCIVEGVIDMMSLVAMGWKGSILGLPGVGLVKKALKVLTGPLKGKKTFIALDGDEAGRGATDKILEACPSASVIPLPEGRDLNDLLMEGIKDWRDLNIVEERQVA